MTNDKFANTRALEEAVAAVLATLPAGFQCCDRTDTNYPANCVAVCLPAVRAIEPTDTRGVVRFYFDWRRSLDIRLSLVGFPELAASSNPAAVLQSHLISTCRGRANFHFGYDPAAGDFRIGKIVLRRRQRKFRTPVLR